MPRLSRRRVRALLVLLIVPIAVGCLLLAWRYVEAARSDKATVNQATYLGTALGLLTSSAGLVAWLGRKQSQLTATEALQAQLATVLNRRLRQLRLTDAQIELELVANATGRAVTLSEFLVLVRQDDLPQYIVVGRSGSGKSYLCTLLAVSMLSGAQQRLPVLVPMSGLSGGGYIGDTLTTFMAEQFNLSRATARDLVATGRVLPIFDGLDELDSKDDGGAGAGEFLRELWAWRAHNNAYVLTSRSDLWDDLPLGLRTAGAGLGYRLTSVPPAAATAYLAASLEADPASDVPGTVVRALLERTEGGLLESAHTLAMTARIADAAVGQGRVAALENVSEETIYREFLTATLQAEKRPVGRLLNSLALFELAAYARYLAANLSSATTFSGRRLESRDLLLFRAWPIAGRTAPRVVDALLACVLSAPGLAWAAVFFWGRGPVLRGLYVVFALIWLSMLVRTCFKPWVRAAVPDWSRLGSPGFLVRQTAAAAALAVISGAVAGWAFAVLAFATAWLAIGLSVGFGQTLTTDTQVRVVGPTGVLKREHQVSRLAALAVLPATIWAFASTFGWVPGTVGAVFYCLLVGETVASALWRRYLAFSLCRLWRVPITPAAVMSRGYAMNLLRTGGMSYQFRHDALLELMSTWDESRWWGLRTARRLKATPARPIP